METKIDGHRISAGKVRNNQNSMLKFSVNMLIHRAFDVAKIF